MITLYRPVLISSAEQAEALPEGTLTSYGTGYETLSASKVGTNAWWTTDPTGDRWDSLDRHMVGWTALVPIEVEVEYIRESGGRRREKTLYVTPWVSSGPDSAAAEAQARADCGDEA